MHAQHQVVECILNHKHRAWLTVGCLAMARMDFLWCVNTTLERWLRRSHRRMVLSWLPLITCTPYTHSIHTTLTHSPHCSSQMGEKSGKMWSCTRRMHTHMHIMHVTITPKHFELQIVAAETQSAKDLKAHTPTRQACQAHTHGPQQQSTSRNTSGYHCTSISATPQHTPPSAPTAGTTAHAPVDPLHR